jgi:hypothetical protein
VALEAEQRAVALQEFQMLAGIEPIEHGAYAPSARILARS